MPGTGGTGTWPWQCIQQLFCDRFLDLTTINGDLTNINGDLTTINGDLMVI